VDKQIVSVVLARLGVAGHHCIHRAGICRDDRDLRL